jgi:hypothetical protein
MENVNLKQNSNVLYTLLCAVNFRFKKYINKLSNRIRCEHNKYQNLYCNDTGLFMYGKCINCGKKRYWRN